jgi:ABC transporter ATM
VANVHVPFLFKQAVDGLSGGATVVPMWGVAALTPAALLVGYGLARGGAALCNGARARLPCMRMRISAR